MHTPPPQLLDALCSLWDRERPSQLDPSMAQSEAFHTRQKLISVTCLQLGKNQLLEILTAELSYSRKNWPQKESQPLSCPWEEFKAGSLQGAASHSEMEQMRNLDLKASRLWGNSGPNLCFPTSHFSLVVVSRFTWLSGRVFQEATVETYWFQFCLIFWEMAQKAGIWPRLMSKLHWTLQAPLLAF